jgi:hypothetical protein
VHPLINLVDEHDPFDIGNRSFRDFIELRQKISDPRQEAPDAIGKNADRQRDIALGEEVSLLVRLLEAVDIVRKKCIEQPANLAAVARLGEPLLEGYEVNVLEEQVGCTVPEFAEEPALLAPRNEP